MKFRTTLILAAVLAGLALGYFAFRNQTETTETPPVGTSPVAREVLDTELGDLVKIVCRGEDGEEWVFEKPAEPEDEGTRQWRMTSPQEMKVVAWEVDRIGRQLSGLQYDMSYPPDEPGGITAAQAGLDPPQATVTLEDAEGETVTVEIGRPASPNTTYVRLAGSEEICVGKASLRNLLKDSVLDYRDKQLWSFDPADVTRVEIVDRSAALEPVNYAFGRDGGRWMMESPVTAKVTSKLDEMLRSMRSLRAIEWHDDRPDRVAGYGFDPAALTIRVTVEEEMEAEQSAQTESGEEDASESADPAEEAEEETVEPQIEITVYELHVSDQSPIGEDTKVYIRVGDEAMVGTIMKSVADKFKPVMSEWRDMHITGANVRGATRIELSTPEGAATLVGEEGVWSFAGDGGAAEVTAVEELLGAIADLEAVAFVDGEVSDPAGFGLDQPQAEIRLTIPGVEDVERIAVGGYTDPETKRLVYVRRNEAASVAKVRATDLEIILRGPRAYRDRTVFAIPPDTVSELTLSVEQRLAEGRRTLTFKRDEEGEWSMSAPVEGAVQSTLVADLVEAVARLRGESISAESAAPSAYGLDAPTATVVLVTDSAEDSVELAVNRHQGATYGKRSDRPTIYILPADFYDQLVLEYRSDKVLTFDDAAVETLAIREGEETHVFNRADDGGWTYQAEPDLPLDAKKIDNLLLQIGDLRTERFIADTTPQPLGYGLAEPQHEIRITLEDGSSSVLWVSREPCAADPRGGFYAVVADRPGVFLLTSDTIQRFAVSLDQLEATP